MSSKARTRLDQPAETGSPPASDLALILAELRRLGELQAIATAQQQACTDLLRACNDLLECLPGRVAAELQRGTGATVTAVERRALARLLPRLSAEIGNLEWSLADLAIDSPALFAELASAAGAHGAAPMKAMGRWLQRADGVVVDGLRIERRHRSRDGVRWRVQQL